MLLSHGHRVIFVHVGRTGGTSVERALAPVLGVPFEETYRCPEIVAGRSQVEGPFARWARELHPDGYINCKHATAAQLRAIVGESVWDSYFKFSIVRNPYDRLISVFHMYKSAPMYADHPVRSYDRFGDYVDALRRDPGSATDANRMSASILDASDRSMVDVILRYEQLQKDFESLRTRLRVPGVELPHENMTERRRGISEYYDAAGRKVVYALYQRDFQAFGYSEEL